jgi:hypothetical protein
LRLVCQPQYTGDGVGRNALARKYPQHCLYDVV